MIDFFRKYVSVVALILMGLFLLDLTSTAQEDLYVMEQTEILSNMSFDGDEFDEDEEENSITIYGDPSSFSAIQKHLEENGFEVTGAEFTRIPNDLKEVTAEQRETIDKMVEKLEDFDDVQTVYTNMKPAE